MYINGNLTHVLDGVICDSADIMYANNRIIDLTEYVNQYMPNYKKVLDTVEDVRKSAVFNIDGEEKILGIVTVNESYKDVNFGYEYRRDWIVKYGSNPQTGAAFSGGYGRERSGQLGGRCGVPQRRKRPGVHQRLGVDVRHL